jgi:hypothetical protein
LSARNQFAVCDTTAAKFGCHPRQPIAYRNNFCRLFLGAFFEYKRCRRSGSNASTFKAVVARDRNPVNAVSQGASDECMADFVTGNLSISFWRSAWDRIFIFHKSFPI